MRAGDSDWHNLPSQDENTCWHVHKSCCMYSAAWACSAKEECNPRPRCLFYPRYSYLVRGLARHGVPLEEIAAHQSAGDKCKLNGLVFHLMLDFNKFSVSKKKKISWTAFPAIIRSSKRLLIWSGAMIAREESNPATHWGSDSAEPKFLKWVTRRLHNYPADTWMQCIIKGGSIFKLFVAPSPFARMASFHLAYGITSCAAPREPKVGSRGREPG